MLPRRVRAAVYVQSEPAPKRQAQNASVAAFCVKLSGKRTAGDDCILNTARVQVPSAALRYAYARDRKNDDGYDYVHRSFFIF